MITNRPCLRCHAPLVPDQAILYDARRAEITLDFVPLRCQHGHTERLMLPRRPAVRYLPTCGYCGEVVFEVKHNGKRGMLNHPACCTAGSSPRLPHRYVEVEV